MLQIAIRPCFSFAKCSPRCIAIFLHPTAKPPACPIGRSWDLPVFRGCPASYSICRRPDAVWCSVSHRQLHCSTKLLCADSRESRALPDDGKFVYFAHLSHSQRTLGSLVYEHPYPKVLLVPKAYSLFSGFLGLGFFPLSWYHYLMGTPLFGEIIGDVEIIALSVGMIGLMGSPFVVHLLLKRLILKLYYNRDSRMLTLVRYNFAGSLIAQRVNIDDVEPIGLKNQTASVRIHGATVCIREDGMNDLSILDELLEAIDTPEGEEIADEDERSREGRS